MIDNANKQIYPKIKHQTQKLLNSNAAVHCRIYSELSRLKNIRDNIIRGNYL